jgi:hypothetical protein
VFRDELTTAIQGLADTRPGWERDSPHGDLDVCPRRGHPVPAPVRHGDRGLVDGGLGESQRNSSPPDYDEDFLADKVTTARFYGEHLLPRANGLVATIKAGNGLLAEANL